MSNDLGWVTANIAAFNDVGSSGYPIPAGGATGDVKSTAACGKLCVAGTGWDGPSGVGSPNGTKLAPLGNSSGGPTDAGADATVEDAGNGSGSGSGGGSGTGSGSGSGSGSGIGGASGSSSGVVFGGSSGGSGSGSSGGSGSGSSGGSGDGSNGATGGSSSSSGCSCRSAPGAGTVGVGGMAWLGLAAIGLFRGRRRSRAHGRAAR